VARSNDCRRHPPGTPLPQERRYLPTGRTATRPTGESVIEMMARDYFVERLWLSIDGTALWEQQPLAL